MEYIRKVSIVLVAISITGIFAIPFGDPQFLDRAIILEITFVLLALFTWKKYRKALYPCIPIALAIIIGNSLAPPHVQIMTTFSRPLNAILLIIGGYILQIILIFTTIKALHTKNRYPKNNKKDKVVEYRKKDSSS